MQNIQLLSALSHKISSSNTFFLKFSNNFLFRSAMCCFQFKLQSSHCDSKIFYTNNPAYKVTVKFISDKQDNCMVNILKVIVFWFLQLHADLVAKIQVAINEHIKTLDNEINDMTDPSVYTGISGIAQLFLFTGRRLSRRSDLLVNTYFSFSLNLSIINQCRINNYAFLLDLSNRLAEVKFLSS